MNLRVRQKIILSWIITVPILALSLAFQAHAVILYATGDPEANTSAPTGDLVDSGWQWAGLWGSFMGTPIRLSFRKKNKRDE